ncbi:LamG domain-containing protein [Fodinicola feengrottensis]|uniref:hypothetical protein n=1 Tax=Fodinicola feengrottensis TaxID=435914 RepID=UPI0036F2D076
MATNPAASVSLWFKTSTPLGVLFSYSDKTADNQATKGGFVPALYVGASGKLYGLLWKSATNAPITTTGTVTDGNWHHVVLSGSLTRRRCGWTGRRSERPAARVRIPVAGTSRWLCSTGTSAPDTWPRRTRTNRIRVTPVVRRTTSTVRSPMSAFTPASSPPRPPRRCTGRGPHRSGC